MRQLRGKPYLGEEGERKSWKQRGSSEEELEAARKSWKQRGPERKSQCRN
jgi:hypothetical protein